MRPRLLLVAGLMTPLLVAGQMTPLLGLHREDHQPQPQRENGPCITGIPQGDTARFTGVMVPRGYWFASDPHPPGAARIWTDQEGRFHYDESWPQDTTRFVLSGAVEFAGNGVPRVINTMRRRNGVQTASERVEHVGDSVIVVRDGRATTELGPADVLWLPAARSALLRTLILQCVLGRGEQTLRSADGGVLRVREITTVTFATRRGSEPATLYVLSSDSVAQMAAVWLHPRTQQLIAYRNAEGVMDLLAEGWENSRDAIGTAEGLAARVPGTPESCIGGTGVGGCERDAVTLNETCKAKVRSLTLPQGRGGGAFTFTDSGHAITSDGRGPYRSGEANVRNVSGGPGNAFVLYETRSEPTRTFTVDLSRPVPGDIAVPLGRIMVDAPRQRSFVPAGAGYSLEISALYFNEDTTEFTGNIPVGTTVRGQLFINFYVNGLLHVLYAGPSTQTPGICGTFGGDMLYGDGTTAALISRPTATSWVVSLPPGSVARLFDSSREEKNAVNRGLYYISLRGTWER